VGPEKHTEAKGGGAGSLVLYARNVPPNAPLHQSHNDVYSIRLRGQNQRKVVAVRRVSRDSSGGLLWEAKRGQDLRLHWGSVILSLLNLSG
jgi:hypothetical protein